MALFAGLGAAIVRGGAALLRSVGLKSAAGRGAKAAGAAGEAASRVTPTVITSTPSNVHGIRAGLGAKPQPTRAPARPTQEWPAAKEAPRAKPGADIPQSDKWKKMSVEEKFGALDKAGQAKGFADTVRQKTGVATPSQSQVVQSAQEASDDRQKQRDDESKASKAKASEAARSAVKTGLFVALFPPAFLFSIKKMTNLLAAFAEGTLESSRGLRRFDASINTTFAKLERQNIRLGAQQAQATSGSTTMLGNQWRKLKDEVQPIREMMGTLLNIIGTGAVEALRGMVVIVNMLFKYHPMFATMVAIAKKLEAKGGGGAGVSEYMKFLDDVRSGKYGGP